MLLLCICFRNNERTPQKLVYDKLYNEIRGIMLRIDQHIGKGIIGIVDIIQLFVPAGVVAVPHRGKLFDMLKAPPLPLKDTFRAYLFRGIEIHF